MRSRRRSAALAAGSSLCAAAPAPGSRKGWKEYGVSCVHRNSKQIAEIMRQAHARLPAVKVGIQRLAWRRIAGLVHVRHQAKPRPAAAHRIAELGRAEIVAKTVLR